MAPRRINVIDCYHGNNIPAGAFASMKAAGLFGVILKASQGSHYRDPAFMQRAIDASAAGLLVAAYHFLDGSDVAAQADNFMGATFENPKLPAGIGAWADYEDYGANSASLRQLVEFMKQIDQRSPDGVSCGLYSGNRIRETLTAPKGGHHDPFMVGVEGFFQQKRLWLAQYGVRCIAPWPWSEPMRESATDGRDGVMPSEPQDDAPGVFLWQFTETGKFPPLPGATDGNFFDGTFEQLQQRWLA